MDQQSRSSPSTALKQTKDPARPKKQARVRYEDEEIDSVSTARSKQHNSTAEMTDDSPHRVRRRGLRQSIEMDDELDMSQREVISAKTRSNQGQEPLPRTVLNRTGELIIIQGNPATDEEMDDSSILSDQPDDGGHSYVDHSEPDADSTSYTSDATPRGGGDGDESSSQHEGTDEDVFTDKSPRSSLGSYDAGSESGKGVDADNDNMTTITRSPRISDISQYEKEDFVPTARGTPRPPFRTPSDVRAMQMSSPAGSVLGSPRSSRKHFSTGSRLGTPSASAQYSPKGKSTPPRFKSRQEAPLVLLHVTLLPLRWMWGDLVNSMDPAEMSEQAKTLRNSWRILQDRVGDTVVERGVLLGHPQNDYEVLEERLLEALDLPVRRRARILECGHYLGPSNEATLVEEEEESEDDYGQERQERRQSGPKRHWCATCKSEIRFDPLGEVKVFRVKVYASNGLMRAGAWEACWKEMERVDVELEPIVEPAVQDEIVRLAAAQQERDIAQKEADIVKEVEHQFEEQRRSEEHLQRHRAQSSPASDSELGPEASHKSSRESGSSRRRQRGEEERLREIYGRTPPRSGSYDRQPSFHRAPPSSPPPAGEASESRGTPRREYQSASLPQLLFQSARVLIQDRKNVIIFTLSVFVLILSLRATPPELTYEPIVHRQKPVSEMRHIPVVDSPPAIQEQQRPIEAHVMEPIAVMSSFDEPLDSSFEPELFFEPPDSEFPEPNLDDSVIIDQLPEIHVASEIEVQSAEDVVAEPTSIPVICGPAVSDIPRAEEPMHETVEKTAEETTEAIAEPVVEPAVEPSAEPTADEIVEEVVEEIAQKIETTTERKVVKVIRTVTQTQTQTQTETEIETQTEVETATAIETVRVQPTENPQPETLPNPEEELREQAVDSQGEAVPETPVPNAESIGCVYVAQSTSEPVPEATLEPEPAPESTLEPEREPQSMPEPDLVPESVTESVTESVAEATTVPQARPMTRCAEV
ncbi:hypothetical protein F5Y14DRAFT_420614 [Nemania sp. NC0429]|nr:hypothetical protein F5Y14DRAFT_420614 [Nemania sp. NC0429]